MIQSTITDTLREGQSKVSSSYGDVNQGIAVAYGVLYGLGAVAHAIHQVGKAIEGDDDAHH
jgi:hypothetical protein